MASRSVNSNTTLWPITVATTWFLSYNYWKSVWNSFFFLFYGFGLSTLHLECPLFPYSFPYFFSFFAHHIFFTPPHSQFLPPHHSFLQFLSLLLWRNWVCMYVWWGVPTINFTTLFCSLLSTNFLFFTIPFVLNQAFLLVVFFSKCGTNVLSSQNNYEGKIQIIYT